MIRTDKAEMSKLLRDAHNEAIEIAARAVDAHARGFASLAVLSIRRELEALAASIRARKITEDGNG